MNLKADHMIKAQSYRYYDECAYYISLSYIVHYYSD